MDEPVQKKQQQPEDAAAPLAADPTRPQRSRTNNPERTMAEILAVAYAEFADKGLAGARIDEIAAATRTSKRMIYYYFGSKEGLYLAVLEGAYREMREQEAELQLESLSPMQALVRLVEYTFDHHRLHENYIRMVMAENINRGEYLKQSPFIQELNVPAISAIEQLYDRGVQQGVFRTGLQALDIHAAISALTFFNVSNAHTFGLIFKVDFKATDMVNHRRQCVVDMMVRYLQA